jgi:hypothetical protein
VPSPRRDVGFSVAGKKKSGSHHLTYGSAETSSQAREFWST